MQRPYAVVDVFGEAPYQGNPVAVVLDAAGLDRARMQAFARWTQLSETTFVLDPDLAGADYRVRIFTPTGELPFAGHPTLGTAHAWLEARGRKIPAGGVGQQCGAGAVRVRPAPGGLAFAAPPLVRCGPAEPEVVARAAAALRLDPAAVRQAQWVDNGPGWLALLLDDAAAVLDVRAGSGDLDLGVVGPYPPGSPAAFEVRAFFPQGGVLVEDPVTGSLNAGLGQWLFATGLVQAPYTVRQGTALGRAGRVEVSRDGSGQVWVAGATVTCVRGSVEL